MMMKLSTMLAVVKTVDQERRSLIGELIAKPWNPEPDSVRFFRSSSNFVFKLTRKGERCFLRFNHADERSREVIQAEVGVINWLAGKGGRVARPLLSTSDSYVETVSTELGDYHAVLFEGLEGLVFEVPEMTREQFHAWGQALGQLHAVLTDCPPVLTEQRLDWLGHLRVAESWLSAADEVGRRELAEVKQWAATLEVPDEDFGLIHYDFEQDNLFWQATGLTILDFDDCARYPFVADIAYALRDLFAEGIKLDHPSFLEFLRGYQEQHPLNQRLLAEFPAFMRMHRAIMYTRLMHSADLPTDYQGKLTDLQNKLTGVTNRLRAGFDR